MEFTDPIPNYQIFINASFAIVVGSILLGFMGIWWEHRRLQQQLRHFEGDSV